MNYFTPDELASLSTEIRATIIIEETRKQAAEARKTEAEENRKAEEIKLKREQLNHRKLFIFLVIYSCFLIISYIFTFITSNYFVVH